MASPRRYERELAARSPQIAEPLTPEQLEELASRERFAQPLRTPEQLEELMARPGDRVERIEPKRVRARTGEIVIEQFVTERFVGEITVREVSK